MADEPAEFWGELGIDPVEIALPGGVGLTLRAYRAPDSVTPTDVSERADEDPFDAKNRADEPELDEEDLPPMDEAELAAQALAAESADETYTRHNSDASDTALDLEPVKDADDTASEDEADETDEEAGLDEVPLFLTHRGRLLLFKSSEGLAEFIRSKAPNDLTQLPEWATLAKSVTAGALEPAEEDTYELDLVVENLRGGHDAWDPDLILSAGEIARDVAFALQLDGVTKMLSPGSPLDQLDEALRAASAGGIGGFMAKRRVKKIGAQQASLGWRSVIGKISSNVDWRD